MSICTEEKACFPLFVGSSLRKKSELEGWKQQSGINQYASSLYAIPNVDVIFSRDQKDTTVTTPSFSD